VTLLEFDRTHHIHLPHFRMPNSLHFPHFNFHFHHHDAHSGSKKEGHDFHKDVPKGCVVMCMGSEVEQQQCFVIPVVYVNHPLFEKLLKEAKEEYGFHFPFIYLGPPVRESSPVQL
jgi:SAUR family protein